MPSGEQRWRVESRDAEWRVEMVTGEQRWRVESRNDEWRVEMASGEQKWRVESRNDEWRVEMASGEYNGEWRVEKIEWLSKGQIIFLYLRAGFLHGSPGQCQFYFGNDEREKNRIYVIKMHTGKICFVVECQLPTGFGRYCDLRQGTL